MSDNDNGENIWVSISRDTLSLDGRRSSFLPYWPTWRRGGTVMIREGQDMMRKFDENNDGGWVVDDDMWLRRRHTSMGHNAAASRPWGWEPLAVHHATMMRKLENNDVGWCWWWCGWGGNIHRWDTRLLPRHPDVDPSLFIMQQCRRLEKNGGRADVHRCRGRRWVCIFTEIIVASYLN